MNSVTKTAKTVQAAIEMALDELELLRDDADIEIIDEGSKGFLGMGAKDAVVKVSCKAVDLESRARDFLSDIFDAMHMNVSIETELSERCLNIDLSGDNMGLIIGKRGDTLDALEHLVSLCVNRGDGEYVKVIVDTENYRRKRQQTLVKLAESLASSVVRNRKKIVLEPMSSNERRIIHSTLQNNAYVDTYSIGDEPNRKVVVALKRNK